MPTRSSGRTTTAESLLLIYACLLGVLSYPTWSKVSRGKPKWTNPCGLDLEASNTEFAKIADLHLLDQILVQAKNALDDAESFREEYVNRTFFVTFREHDNAWGYICFDWLPKDSFKKRNPFIFNTSEDQLDATLVDKFERLQRLAVGLEQVTWDLEDEHLRGRFSDTEYKLRSLLCEVQVALVERGIPAKKDVERDVMSPIYRLVKDKSLRDLRDWIVFRTYIDELKDMVYMFERFKNTKRASDGRI